MPLIKSTSKEAVKDTSHHSENSAKRSSVYHKDVLEPNFTRFTADDLARTKLNHKWQSDQDLDESGHA